MSRVEHELEVDVPARVAYDQWTQFESFPHFMDGVKRVVQLDDKHLEWTAAIAGVERTWTAEITDQTPDVRIAWRSVDGPKHGGAVLFEPLGPERTRVRLAIEAEPDDAVEKVGDALGFLDRQVAGDLERFRDFIEARGTPTGAWRGEIHGEEVRDDPATSSTRQPARSGRLPL
jgi:uncharacterized membrane protein